MLKADRCFGAVNYFVIALFCMEDYVMIPLRQGLFEYKEQIKQMGGKWNGHIWCVPPNADYKQFIKFLPHEILERIN